MKKKIRIKFIFNNRICLRKYSVIIYNKDKKKLFDGTTTQFGYLDFEFPCQGIYKIIVFPEQNSMPDKICIPVFFFDECCNTWTLFFSSTSFENTPITITVTDQNYKGLPIEKGEIRLCQKAI